MMKMTIPINPVTKKNSQQIAVNPYTGRPFIVPSAKYKAYEKDALKFLQRHGNPKIDFPVNVKCLFFMETRRKPDLVNLLEAADDVLVRAGILKDDNSGIIISHDGSRVLYDKKNPRTEIFIERVIV